MFFVYYIIIDLDIKIFNFSFKLKIENNKLQKIKFYFYIYEIENRILENKLKRKIKKICFRLIFLFPIYSFYLNKI